MMMTMLGWKSNMKNLLGIGGMMVAVALMGSVARAESGLDTPGAKGGLGEKGKRPGLAAGKGNARSGDALNRMEEAVGKLRAAGQGERAAQLEKRLGEMKKRIGNARNGARSGRAGFGGAPGGRAFGKSSDAPKSESVFGGTDEGSGKARGSADGRRFREGVNRKPANNRLGAPGGKADGTRKNAGNRKGGSSAKAGALDGSGNGKNRARAAMQKRMEEMQKKMAEMRAKMAEMRGNKDAKKGDGSGSGSGSRALRSGEGRGKFGGMNKRDGKGMKERREIRSGGRDRGGDRSLEGGERNRRRGADGDGSGERRRLRGKGGSGERKGGSADPSSGSSVVTTIIA